MRVLTAIVVVPLLLALMFWGPVWGWYALVAFACLVGASELFGMTHPGDRVAQALGIAMTVGVSAGVYFFSDDPKKLLAVVLLVQAVMALRRRAAGPEAPTDPPTGAEPAFDGA